MRNKLQHSWRSSAIFVLILVMLCSLFFSRAVLSLSMMGFVLVCFLHAGVKQQFATYFSSPLLWGMSLLFLLPLLSGLWSDDKKEWADIMRIKLPLLFLPLAFSAPFPLDKKEWNRIGYLFIALITGACCWSLFHYLQDVTAINESYLKAKTIITPLENDHVRFSWLVSVAVLLSGYFAIINYANKRQLAWLFSIISALLIIFLHVLAVRTGLFSFYIMLAGIICWLLFSKIKRNLALLLIVAMIGLPLIAYQFIPSFKNRVSYFLYDSLFFTKGTYQPGMTDVTRVISMKAGWQVMNDHPATGVGFGDVLPASEAWYSLYYPAMIDSDKIYPASEWLMYGAGCGWPGFVLITAVMLIPFLIKGRYSWTWYLLNATTAFSFMFDIGLEVQFGVFLYAFIILWWYKWLNAEKI